ncbi:unnamed protein product [Larinioides sclopetarius]|uniref:Uncharacterized protein n=1 Tax=Larinioides sclopetarius TaxID=280406 RepID=A0AAV2BRK0_9ARAC
MKASTCQLTQALKVLGLNLAQIVRWDMTVLKDQSTCDAENELWFLHRIRKVRTFLFEWPRDDIQIHVQPANPTAPFHPSSWLHLAP